MKTAELIARAQTGDLASRDQVIADNLKLAWHVAGRFRNTGHDLEEFFKSLPSTYSRQWSASIYPGVWSFPPLL